MFDELPLRTRWQLKQLGELGLFFNLFQCETLRENDFCSLLVHVLLLQSESNHSHHLFLLPLCVQTEGGGGSHSLPLCLFLAIKRFGC